MENKRKLVTIREISNIIEIKDCTEIALGVVDGWSVIIKKSEFKIGDPCVFFEIDSFLPMEPRYEFLKKTTKFNGTEGYRIRTIKMKKVLSQGLALPLSMFPELGLDSLDTQEAIDDNTDFSETLGVIKYDLEQFCGVSNTCKSEKPGKFPSFIPKTDQPRIQNLPHLFLTNKEDTFEETLKLDGSSMTCYKIASNPTLLQKFLSIFGFKTPTTKFGVCSRNVDLKRTANTVMTFNNQGKESVYDQSDFWATALKLDLANKVPVGYAIQGELIGPSIQANHEKVTELQYYVFDVFNISEQRYLLPPERRVFCHALKIPHVPVMSVEATPLQLTLEELLAHVDTESMNPGTVSEGRVYKSNSYPTMSFKVINNKYLLKHEK